MEVVFEGGLTGTTDDLRSCAALWDSLKGADGYPCLDAEGAKTVCEWGTEQAVTYFQEAGCPLSGFPDGSSEDYGAADAYELLTIDSADVSAWLPFYVAGISFPIYPQILVRFYTARNVRHLQYGMQLTHLSVFYLCLPAFLTGYTVLSRDISDWIVTMLI